MSFMATIEVWLSEPAVSVAILCVSLMLACGILGLIQNALSSMLSKCADQEIWTNGEGMFFIYRVSWNRQAHRVARQDWWREVAPMGRKFKPVGSWFKYNVGYTRHPSEPENGPWTWPMRKATTKELNAAHFVRGRDFSNVVRNF